MCSSETYDGHDGTDFRVPNVTSDIDVVAAAAGVIVAVRDGLDDRLATTPELIAAVSKIECGNGVLIKHEGGFETQYCHMKKGSVVAKVGLKVDAGTILGNVGYSGAAAFPHLHLSVRHNGEKLDPFSGPDSQDCHTPPQSLWVPSAAQTLTYQPISLMNLGWAAGPVSAEQLDQGSLTSFKPALNAPALVGYGRLINLKKADELTLAVTGPGGEVAKNKQTPYHDKAQYVLFAGNKIHADWQAGTYKVKIEVLREGKTILSQASDVKVK